MAEVMTYDSLTTDIQTYCERSDDPFVSQIPRFIMMAENRIASEKKSFGLLRTVTGVMNGNVMQKPVRWRKTKNITLITSTGRVTLKLRGYEYCRAYWPDPSKIDVPVYFADYDYEHFFVVPTPAQAYQFELQYYERPEPLDKSNQTNWLTQYAPQLLLYASLIEAMPFLKTSERMQEFQGLYMAALNNIVSEDQERFINASSVRG
jgi:hypothetical protein